MWSQVFSFFVHSVAAEQLCLKVCLKLGSVDSWEDSRPRAGELSVYLGQFPQSAP